MYRCPFCYNKDYSLTNLLRHASRIAGNSRKTVKDIAKHFILITYILRILTPLKEEIDVSRMTEAFLTSVELVEEHSVAEPVVSIEETDEHMVSLGDGANRNDEPPKEKPEEKETEEPEVIEEQAEEIKEEEPYKSLEEMEAEYIHNSLPDEYDLFAGVADGLEYNSHARELC